MICRWRAYSSGTVCNINPRSSALTRPDTTQNARIPRFGYGGMEKWRNEGIGERGTGNREKGIIGMNQAQVKSDKGNRNRNRSPATACQPFLAHGYAKLPTPTCLQPTCPHAHTPTRPHAHFPHCVVTASVAASWPKGRRQKTMASHTEYGVQY